MGQIVEKDDKKAIEYFQRAYDSGSAVGAYYLGLLYELSETVEHDLDKAFKYYQAAAERGDSDGMIKLGIFYHEGTVTEKDINKGIEWLEKAKAAGNPRANQFLNIVYKNGEGDSQAASEHLLKLAENGDVQAQYQIYEAYDNGYGVEKNEDLAQIWCRKAADNGHIIAAALVGFHEMIFGSTVVAVEYWEKAAQGGHLKAATDLADIYLNGAEGVPMNKARAIELLSEAANSGFAEAQNSLGVCYITGNGVPENAAEAVKWFEKAAEQGEEFAMKNLALCLRDGNGVAVNKAKATEWFEKAAAKNNIQSKFNLADMYANGDGVLVNYQKAEALLKEVLASNEQKYHDDALFNLALLYTTKLNDNYKAFPLWQEAAQRGNTTAQYNLGLCYSNGWGTARDDSQAKYWWEKAAGQGDMNAQYNVGLCYYEGKGTVKDIDQALYWWRLAAAQGHENAQYNINVATRERNSYNSGSSYQNSSQSAKSGGCYVATAIYGSYDCPQVWTLRRFRDYKLASTWYGRLFIRAYYAVSPTVVKLFGRTEWFNRFWKARLDTMVTALREQGYEDSPYND